MTGYDVVLTEPGGVLIPRVPPRSTDLLVTGPLPWADVRAYGADPSGVADSTTAFQAALAVAQGGTQPGTLYIPAGDYLLSGAGTELLLITKAVTIRGDGMRSSTLKIAASVGAGVDVIRFYPPDSNEAYGLALRDFGIVAVSGHPARHAINLDITQIAAEVRFVARATLERLWLGNAGTEFGGRAIEFTNPAALNPSMFTSEIQDSQIYGGVRLLNAGDSVLIDNCVISGANGVEVDLVSGAALFTFTRNNVTCDGGVWVKAGAHPVITHNWFEADSGFSGASTNNAVLDLDGKTGAFPAMPEIYGNQMSVLAGLTADGFRLNRCTAARVRDNSCNVAEAGSVGFRATATVTDANDLARDNRKVTGSGSLVVYAGAALSHPTNTVWRDEDDFTSGSLATGDLGKLGWLFLAGTVSVVDDPGNHPGILRHATSAVINTIAAHFLRSTTGTGNVVLPSSFFDVEFICRVNQVDTDTTVRYGLMSNVVGDPSAHGIYFERLAADTNWFAVTRATSVQTRADMGVAMDTAWVTLRIRRVSSTQIGFSINGGTEVLATATIPTLTLQPSRMITNIAVADKTHDLDRFSIIVNGLAR